MLPNQTIENLRSQDSESVLWPVNLNLTHLDWTTEATLIHFQGHYLNICELDYKILHGEIQRTARTKVEVDIGEFCLVEDVTSANWFRGRVQSRTKDLFEVYLLDHGNILTVDATYRSSFSRDLFNLPPKVVCGFFANVLLFHSCPHVSVDKYLSCLIGQSITGYIQARLPYEVLVLEVPDINNDLVQHGFGRHVDKDTFLLLVELLTEVTIQRSMELGIESPYEESKEKELSIKPSVWTKYKHFLECGGPKLISGTRAKVRLTAALLPGMLFFQMVSMERDLCKMSEKLASMCETNKQRGSFTEQISLLCSVKRKDGNWYRGFLSFLPISSHVKVLFVDYGFFETVSVNNIYRLPTEFFQIPLMAFPCSLSMKSQVKVLNSQTLNFLKLSLLGGVLDVEISSFDEEHHQYHITVSDVENNAVKEPETIAKVPLTKAESLSESFQFAGQGTSKDQELFFKKLLKESLKVEGLQVNADFDGFVVNIQNPNTFWIRTQKRNTEFNKMTADIGAYFRQVKLNEDVFLDPQCGQLCCAMYEKDRHFYRGLITGKLIHGAEVLFIDFGNIEKVPHILIKKIPKAFANIPPFAIHCAFANVILWDDVWPAGLCDIFSQAVCGKTLQVHVVQINETQLAVNLNKLERSKSQSIAELLVISNKAKDISLSALPRERRQANNVKYFQKTPNADIIETTKQRKEGINHSKKAPVMRTFKALEINPRCILTVRCYSIISLTDFWCQSLNQASELEVLNEKVQQYYSAHTVALQAGDLCCIAKSPADKKWYRGLITEKENRMATVLLVDYGYTIQVEQQHLQEIMPDFLHLERQAFRCCLYSPQISNGFCEWSPEVCKLKTLVISYTDGLQCIVVSQLDIEKQVKYNVYLYDSKSQQNLINHLNNLGFEMHHRLEAKDWPNVRPESFLFSSYDLRPGMEEEVFVTHVSPQWEFYCHLKRNTEIIHQLEKNISAVSHEPNHDFTTGAAGQKMCLALYSDGQWYRALVQSFHSPFHVSVFYVDYGNVHILEKSGVISIPKDCADLFSTPMQALKFHLDLVPKDEDSADIEEWLKTVVLNKQSRAIIRNLNDNGSFNVELFCEEMSINEQVKELVHKKEKEILSKNLLHVDTKMKNTKSLMQKAEASMQSVSMKSQQKTKAKTRKPKKSKKIVAIAAPAQLPDKELQAGFRGKCFISHIDSTNIFFLQLSEDEPDILKLGDDLNSLTLSSSLTKSLKVGDHVLAEFEEDGAVYRSVVKNYNNSSTLEVEFVDYGNSAVVKKEKIYSIPKEFQSLPRFSISCSFLDTYTASHYDFLTDTNKEKPLMVEFVHKSGTTWKVKLRIFPNDSLQSATEEALPQNKDSPTCSVETNELESPIKTESIDDISESKTSQKISKLEETYVKGMNDCVNAFKPTLINARDRDRCRLLSTVGVGRFYARLNRTTDLLTSLEHPIAQEMEKCKMLTSEDIEEGLECLLQVNENCRQRAVVQQNNGEKCLVFLLDHGITIDCSTSSIRQQQCDYLKSIPNLAVLCEIHELSTGEDAQRLWQEALKPVTGRDVELVFLEYNSEDQLWMVELIVDQPFHIHNNDASKDTKEDIKLSIENTEECSSDPNTPPKPLFSLGRNNSYSGYVASVTSPFDFNIVVEDSTLAFNKVPLMVGDRLVWKCLSDDTCSPWTLKSDIIVDEKTFLNQEESSCNKLLSKNTNILPVYPCTIWGAKPVGETDKWSYEAVKFFRQSLNGKLLQIFFRELSSDKCCGVDILVDGIQIAKKLVNARHAVYTDTLFQIRYLKPLDDSSEYKVSDEEEVSS